VQQEISPQSGITAIRSDGSASAAIPLQPIFPGVQSPAEIIADANSVPGAFARERESDRKPWRKNEKGASRNSGGASFSYVFLTFDSATIAKAISA